MYDRKKAKKALLDQTKEAYNKKDSGSFTSIIRGDTRTWRCGEGKHKIDIIPFLVGKKHWKKKQGDFAYFLEVWTHGNVGPNDDVVVCLNKTLGEECPICNYRKQLQQSGEGDEDTIKALRPKQRTLYNIVCYDSDEQRQKGVQVWDVAHFFMEQKLLAIATDDETGELIAYADPDDGKRISFQRKGSGAGNTSYLGHKLVDRDYKITDKILAQAYSLDEVLIILSYQEIERMLFGGKRDKPKNDDEDDDDALNFSDDDTSSDENVDFSSMSRKELKQYIKDHDLDVDSDDYEEKSDLVAAIEEAVSGASENEATTNRGSTKKLDDDLVCPHKKGTFGVDFDSFDICGDCDLFDECRVTSEGEVNDKEVKKQSSKTLVRRGGAKK